MNITTREDTIQIGEAAETLLSNPVIEDVVAVEKVECRDSGGGQES